MKIQRIDIIEETTVIANTYESEAVANGGLSPLSTESFEIEGNLEELLISKGFVLGNFSWQKVVD